VDILCPGVTKSSTMAREISQELERLRRLAYHRLEWSRDLVRRFHEMREVVSASPDGCLVEQVYEWLFVPLTLWPVNMHDLLAQALDLIAAKRSLGERMCLLVNFIGNPPNEAACSTAARHEHDVRQGQYESFIDAQAKFDDTDEELSGFSAEWDRIKSTFKVDRYRDHKGIIRRTSIPERNFRQDFDLNWKSRDAQFQAVFDAFCCRWNLYGVQGDMPLLLKLSVNLTPYGTMIFIPAYWSFDPNRDIEWKEVTALHRSRVPKRQGQSLRENRAERRQNAAQARILVAKAKALGLKGEERHAFVCEGLHWSVETDRSRLRRLLKEFPEQGPVVEKKAAHPL
jgi:hypothetical protein